MNRIQAEVEKGMYRRYPGFLVLLVCYMLGIGLAIAEDLKGLRMIVVRDKSEAQKIRQQLRKGASFSALAAQKSTGPERRSWGYSGTVHIDDVQPKLRSVLKKLRLGQISDVVEMGQRFVIVKVISPQIERHYTAADRAAEQGKTDAAVKELKAALRLETDSIKTYLKLAVVYSLVKRYKEAFPYLEKAQRYAPQSTQVLVMRSATYTNAAIEYKNRTYADTALQDYKKILQTDEYLAPAVHFGIGKVYLAALQQPQKAIGHLEKAVKRTPKVAEVYQLLIQAYYDTKRYDKAWDYLRLAQSLGFKFSKLRDALHKVKPQNQR